MTIKISALDRLFSRYIRFVRDSRTCQRCGKVYPAKTQGLDCAHVFSRAKKSVRFYPDNAVSLCSFPCHRDLDLHTTEKHAWWRARIGEARWAKLLLNMSVPAKVDGVMVKRWLEAELKESN